MSEYYKIDTSFDVVVPTVETSMEIDIPNFEQEVEIEINLDKLTEKVVDCIDVDDITQQISESLDNEWFRDMFDDCVHREANAFQDQLNADDLCPTGQSVYDMVEKIIRHVLEKQGYAYYKGAQTPVEEQTLGEDRLAERVLAIESFLRRTSQDAYESFTKLQSPAQQGRGEPF